MILRKDRDGFPVAVTDYDAALQLLNCNVCCNGTRKFCTDVRSFRRLPLRFLLSWGPSRGPIPVIDPATGIVTTYPIYQEVELPIRE